MVARCPQASLSRPAATAAVSETPCVCACPSDSPKQYDYKSPTLMLHFSTGRQTFYVGYLKFYAFLTGTKACITAADLIDSGENLHCFTRLLSSCNIKISIVSQCRILVAVHTTVRVFFVDWQVAPAGLLNDLITVDADWRRLNLLTDSGRTSLETQHKFETDSDSCHTLHRSLHCLQTVHCGHAQQQSPDDTMSKTATYEISSNSPIRAALTFQCRHRRLCL